MRTGLDSLSFFTANVIQSRWGENEVGKFLQHLALNKGVAASTQNQALNAIVFLYGSVLKRPLGKLPHVFRAKRPKRLSPFFTHIGARLSIFQVSRGVPILPVQKCAILCDRNGGRIALLQME
jgi:hypothetical protein